MKILSKISKRSEKLITFVIIVSTVLWASGFGFVLNSNAKAAALSNISDTLSDSDFSVGSNHVVAYTSTYDVADASTITVEFAATGHEFNLDTLVVGDISATGMTRVGVCTGPVTDEVTASIDTGSDTVTFTVCSGDTVAAGAKTITFGNTKIVNPAGPTASYVIRVTSNGSTAETGDTRVTIIDDVVMTASVDTIFNFVIAGLNTGITVNGETTTATSSATAISFGTLVPDAAEVMGQELTVGTNAQNGFVVTVFQNQNLLSANGADIDLFSDGTAIATPAVWAAPLNTIDVEDTFGHYGITSDDTNLSTDTGSAKDDFTGSKFAGNITSARAVFAHTAPANGTEQNKGLAKVAIKIEVASMQEAATDYNNILTYIATPTF